MFGFIIGTLCLIAFFSLLLRRRWWGRSGGYGRCGPHRGHFGYGPSRLTYHAFEALDTSPGQEKAIRAALGELRKSLAELRPELDATRAQLAQTLGVEQFDAAPPAPPLGRERRPGEPAGRASGAPRGAHGARVRSAGGADAPGGAGGRALGLLELAGRSDVSVSDRAVDVHVSHLRRKLGDDPPRLIRTVRGVGYMFARDDDA